MLCCIDAAHLFWHINDTEHIEKGMLHHLRLGIYMDGLVLVYVRWAFLHFTLTYWIIVLLFLVVCVTPSSAHLLCIVARCQVPFSDAIRFGPSRWKNCTGNDRYIVFYCIYILKCVHPTFLQVYKVFWLLFVQNIKLTSAFLLLFNQIKTKQLKLRMA